MDIYDCIIVGGGPAGLLAAIYLARFRRSVLLIENNNSRASLIPKSHNYPGAERGIAGEKILQQLKDQLNHYAHQYVKDTVIQCKKISANEFNVITSQKTYSSKKIILAAGMQDTQIDLPSIEKGIKQGNVRHCVICDGYEIINKKIAAFGCTFHTLLEVEFILTYTKDISLFTLGRELKIDEKSEKFFKEHNIPIIKDKINELVFNEDQTTVITYGQTEEKYDAIYTCLGCTVNSEFTPQLNLKLKENKKIVTDADHQTSCEGVYACGDMTNEVAQIVTAFGSAAIAATHIHNTLIKEANAAE